MKLSVFNRRWQALQAKESGADFLYGVSSTGIYCRPACPSRLPLRENVRFFDSCKEAELAGFRACKRCGPDTELQDRDRYEVIIKACRFMEEAETPPSLKELSAEFNYSVWHFQRIFSDITGCSPKAYSDALRKIRFRENLCRSSSITEAIYASGFGSSSRVYERSGEWLAMNPGEYRKGGPGQIIHYGVTDCSLGRVLAASTLRGICSIALGDEDESLILELRKRFSKAEIYPAGKGYESILVQVVQMLDKRGSSLDLPLDIQGTLFQEKVWRVLRQIPPGETRSYSEIAAELGSPESSRAVANACGANKLAVAIPCHRVVRKDHGLGGYRWGLDRKRGLLEKESFENSEK